MHQILFLKCNIQNNQQELLNFNNLKLISMYDNNYPQEYINQTTNQEYKIWKKNVPFLYNILQTYQLSTCSNTIQWLPYKQSQENYISYKCLIGTNSIQKNCLLIFKVMIPNNNTLCDLTQYKLQANIGQLGLRKIQIQQLISQNSQVMRARINPIKSSLIASKCGGVNPQLNIYDLTEGDHQNQEPLIKLQGHTSQGLGLDWNPKRQNYILSGSMDRKICLWDIQASTQIDTNLKPLQEYLFHSMGVEDVCWNKFQPDIFATCGQDKLIAIWDLREKRKKPEIQKTAHSSEIYSLDFSPFSENLLLSAGQDAEIGLWDLRNIQKRIQTFTGHLDSINKVQWSPHNRLLFASCSNDRRSIIWDIQKCGQLNQYDQPAEIVFIHGGHKSRVNDIDWSPQNFMLGSTEQSNTAQCWRMVDNLSEEYVK